LTSLATRRNALIFILGGAASGCNPVISLAGASFPVWILCLAVGILVTLSLKPLFVAIGLDEGIVLKPIVYPCLALVVAFLIWLLVWK
jgi:YtcA family